MKRERPGTDALNVNDAILEVIALIHGEAVKNGVTIQRRLADHLPNIQGDRIRLQQVILNLMVNAIQAMSGVTEGVRELHNRHREASRRKVCASGCGTLGRG